MTAALWWLYFNYVARIAQRRLELSPERTRLARDAYTYLHVVIVAGVIVSALPKAKLAAVVAGPAIYLLAHVLFRLRMTGSLSRKRLLGALACLAIGGVGAFVPALVVAALVIAALAAVIGAEHVAAARRSARGEPSPLERLETSPARQEHES